MNIAETERLVLRGFHIGDLDALTDLFSNPEVMRFGSGPQDRDYTRQFILGCLQKYHTHWGFGLWAVVEKQSLETMGFCGLCVQEVDGEQEVELGYRLRHKYWGHGFATEAAIACRDYAFANLGLKRLISIIEAANTASIRVAEKNGMQLEKETVKWQKQVRIYSVSGT